MTHTLEHKRKVRTIELLVEHGALAALQVVIVQLQHRHAVDHHDALLADAARAAQPVPCCVHG